MYSNVFEGKTSILWKCVRRTRGCKGTIKTDLNQAQLRTANTHNHDVDLVGAEMQKNYLN